MDKKVLAIDPSRHASLEQLRSGLAQLTPQPRDVGEVRLIVRRLVSGGRDEPQSAELSCEEGVVGDAWSARPPRDLLCQITVMQYDVAQMIANGQSLTLFGDNLFVDLDLAAENLPPGSRLEVGAATVEVTPEPHTGCSLFKERFGFDALKLTALKDTRAMRLRGVHFRVVDPGRVCVGDTVKIASRG